VHEGALGELGHGQVAQEDEEAAHSDRVEAGEAVEVLAASQAAHGVNLVLADRAVRRPDDGGEDVLSCGCVSGAEVTVGLLALLSGGGVIRSAFEGGVPDSLGRLFSLAADFLLWLDPGSLLSEDESVTIPEVWLFLWFGGRSLRGLLRHLTRRENQVAQHFVGSR